MNAISIDVGSQRSAPQGTFLFRLTRYAFGLIRVETIANWRCLGGMSNSIWPRNRLLLALPPRNLKRLMPHLEIIPCVREQVLMDADSSLDHVFFPDSGVVSVVAVYEDGSIIEMASVCCVTGCAMLKGFGHLRFYLEAPQLRLCVFIA